MMTKGETSAESFVSIVALIAFALMLVSCAQQAPQSAPANTESVSSEFLEKHWLRPLPEQGTPAVTFTAREKSLFPKDCKSCHVPQYQDWQGSRHSLAMGPGLMGQLLDFDPADSASQQDCLHCHAPLAEQATSLLEQLEDIASGKFDVAAIGKTETLHEQGVICAACHYRGYTVYGPPRNPGLPPPDPGQVNSHNGFVEEPDFESSEFCAACHQFEPDGNRIAGKLIENTYEEWKQSRYAAEGVTCQKCHMPDRRHLWRGIHDPETTAGGVMIKQSEILLFVDTLSTSLTLTNTNTGHNFPTYVTPKVYLQGYQIDKDGAVISETFQQETIGWEISSTLDGELFDTRLAPDEAHTLQYKAPLDSQAVDITLRVMVDPDNFYRNFYDAKLSGGYTDLGADQILQAYQESRVSFYPLYESIRRIR